MKAIYLVKNGAAEKAFELRKSELPQVGPLDIRIKVKAFGLNFADVMARLGVYPDAPAKPGVLGYDVIGWVDDIGTDVKTSLKKDDHVIALTRFGGYAEFVCTDHRGVVKINEDIDPAIGTALATQGGTAYYMAKEMVNIYEGDHVLVHAAAGGVGSILCQIAKSKGAVVYGTAGSAEKLEYLTSIGVNHPINYRSQDFFSIISELRKSQGISGLDVVFDPVGGGSVRKGFKLLGAGGRLVLFGASSMTNAKNVFSKLGVAKGFGLYHPIALLSPSKALIGVNMLRIADDKPDVLNRVLEGTVQLYQDGLIKPLSGGIYKVDELAKAHTLLQNRATMGKIAIEW